MACHSLMVQRDWDCPATEISASGSTAECRIYWCRQRHPFYIIPSLISCRQRIPQFLQMNAGWREGGNGKYVIHEVYADIISINSGLSILKLNDKWMWEVPPNRVSPHSYRQDVDWKYVVCVIHPTNHMCQCIPKSSGNLLVTNLEIQITTNSQYIFGSWRRVTVSTA